MSRATSPDTSLNVSDLLKQAARIQAKRTELEASISHASSDAERTKLKNELKALEYGRQASMMSGAGKALSTSNRNHENAREIAAFVGEMKGFEEVVEFLNSSAPTFDKGSVPTLDELRKAVPAAMALLAQREQELNEMRRQTTDTAKLAEMDALKHAFDVTKTVLNRLASEA